MAEETPVEKTWRLMSEGDPTVRRGDQAVMEAEYAEPRLRVLFPFPSHGCLTFHRNSQVPVEQRPSVHRGQRVVFGVRAVVLVGLG
ncbi:DUF6193 family natural product biosynthesis protein [Streptomyces yangpuensis]|uniref:DUF6193 family natural product biosynthesis protein n=1 Tax=Streptomyces yangpuensis TaxID=1648182 RepID=UPI00380586BE